MLCTIIDKLQKMDTEEFTIIFIASAVTAIFGAIITGITLCSIVSSICGIFGGTAG